MAQAARRQVHAQRAGRRGHNFLRLLQPLPLPFSRLGIELGLNLLRRLGAVPGKESRVVRDHGLLRVQEVAALGLAQVLAQFLQFVKAISRSFFFSCSASRYSSALKVRTTGAASGSRVMVPPNLL